MRSNPFAVIVLVGLLLTVNGCAKIYPTKFSMEIPPLADPAMVKNHNLSIGVAGFERADMKVVGSSSSVGTAYGTGTGRVVGSYDSANIQSSANAWGIGATVDQQLVTSFEDLENFKYALEDTRLFKKVEISYECDFNVIGKVEPPIRKVNWLITLPSIVLYTWLLGAPFSETTLQNSYVRIYDKKNHFIKQFGRTTQTKYLYSLFRYGEFYPDQHKELGRKELIQALANDVANEIVNICKTKKIGD